MLKEIWDLIKEFGIKGKKRKYVLLVLITIAVAVFVKKEFFEKNEKATSGPAITVDSRDQGKTELKNSNLTLGNNNHINTSDSLANEKAKKTGSK